MSDKNLKVIICVAPPAAGKSTWAKDQVRRKPGYVRVCRDDYRFMLKDTPTLEHRLEEMVTELQNKAIITALNFKQNVILDATHVKEKYIRSVIELVSLYADVEFMVFDVPLNVCITRDRDREKSVGEDVVRRMYKDFEHLKDTFVFQPTQKLPAHMRRMVQREAVPGLPECVIVDIDGTLAHMGKRSPFDWHKVHLDDLNELVAEQVRHHRYLGRKVVLLSGRDEVCREGTEEWLAMYGVEYDHLYMRPKDSFLKDTAVKRALFEEHIEPSYNVVCAYDDRIQVVKMWYKLGVFCFNVNQGMFEF